MKKAIRLFLIIFLSYVAFCIFMFLNQKNLLFFPFKGVFIVPKLDNLEEVYIKTEDNIKLNAWYLDNKSDRAIIFFHGNWGNVFFNRERIKIFNELKINAIMPDYRGYGRSWGEILSENDLEKDANATYSYLINKWFKSENIIIWGQSFGGAVAIDLAQNKNIKALVVESAFSSVDEMASSQFPYLPIKFLLKFHFRNDEKISKIHVPVLIIHSINDEIINFSNWEKLFPLANEPKFFLKTSGTHNGWFSSSFDLYVSTFRDFLKL